MIQQGSATVVVVQMPAARITDPTVHGGVIVTGCPTVIIGGPAAAAVMRGNTTVIVDRVNQTIPTHSWVRRNSGNRSQPGLCRSREPDDQQHLERADPVRREKLSGHGNDFRSVRNPGDPPMPGTIRSTWFRRRSHCRDQPARPLEISHSTGRLRVTSTARTWTELS